MRVAENEANAKRKSISVFNTVERLNKHPSVFINYLRVLASAKGMTFTIQYPPPPPPKNLRRRIKQRRQQRRRGRRRRWSARSATSWSAKDLSHEEYEEISKRKKMGKTTTEENLQAEKHYWQNFFLTKD